MQLESLSVFHLRKRSAQSAVAAPNLGIENAFHLDTCQRWLWISQASHGHPVSQVSQNLKASHSMPEGLEAFRGREAYRFLLRFAAGLTSEVIGETDVFGQFKDAWRKVKFSGSSLSMDLGPWVQRVFEDTKEIRTLYLQNVGGSSYGTLVRKLLKDSLTSSGTMNMGLGAAFGGPTLIVGAGQSARSIAPYLTESEIWLANRNPASLEEFYLELSQKPGARVRKMETPEAVLKAWKNARNVVVCVPGHLDGDEEKLKQFCQGGLEGRSIVHLGLMRKHANMWTSTLRFYCLDDLFSLQNSMMNVRSVQISRAEKACEERAQLRALGTSLSISHGWEDLACFA